MITVNSAVAILICATIASTSAHTLEPPSRPEEVRGEGTLRIQPAVGIRMGQLFVRFEQTKLADVASGARIGTIDHHGDAAGSEYFLCYTRTSNRQPFRVWIISSGEMGGPEHAVTEVVAHRVEAADAASDSCPSLPAHLQPVTLDRGVWLGTTREELLKKLGPESASRDEWLVFNFLGTVPGPYGGAGNEAQKIVNWDVTNILEARIKNGRVEAIWASRVTSY